ncbi:MAG: DNRLRE domain-containing protein [Clostridia bacterium]|nr:DNRLRE domain-containing protein [Clostridia bacterium]
MKRRLSAFLSAVIFTSAAALCPINNTVSHATPDTQVSLLPVDDTFVQNGSGNTNKNFGAESTLRVAYTSDSGLSINSGYTEYSTDDRGALGTARNTYMRFDIGDIDTNTIKSALLRLTISAVSNIGSTNSYNALSTNILVFPTADNDWTEENATWDEVPAASNVVAGISQQISSANSSEGTVVTVDLTSFFRENPPLEDSEYSFIIMANAAGVTFYSKEALDTAKRPSLDIIYNSALIHSNFISDILIDNGFTDSAADTPVVGALRTLSVASTSGSSAADSNKYTYVQIEVPENDLTLYDYAMARFTMCVSDITGGDQVVSVYPVSDNDWTQTSLTWSSQPAHEAEAICSVEIKNDLSAPFTRVVFDVTEYIRTHQHDDGLYSFVLIADTAQTEFFSMTPALPDVSTALLSPKVEFIYMPKNAIKVSYIDETGAPLAEDKFYHEVIGDVFTLDEIPLSLNNNENEYFYTSQLTLDRNRLTLTVSEKPEENIIYLIYQAKELTGYDAVNVTALINDIPSMPETVTLNFDNDTSETTAVKWSEISTAMVAQSALFTLSGTVIGLPEYPVEASVQVLDVREIQAPLITTAPGSMPILPNSLTVIFEDGTIDGAAYSLPATWNEIPSSSYENLGSFTVMGTIERISVHTQLTVLVEEGDIVSNTAAADTFTAQNAPDTNYNDDTSNGKNVLRISGVTDNISGAAITNRKTFLRFDGGNYNDAEDGGLDPIVNAKVRLYFESINNDATPNYKIYGILPENDTWDEATLTWNTQEQHISNAVYISTVAIKQSTFAPSWVEFDVTSFVRENRHAQSFAFYIESDTCAAVISSSAVSGYEPTLDVSKYIPDTTVVVRRVTRNGSGYEDIAPREELTGKLGKHYTYPYAFDDCVAYPDYNSELVYYYNPAASVIEDEVLEEDGNTLYIVYDALEIASVSSLSAETFTGKLPVLPDTVSVTLAATGDFPAASASKIKSVTWNWDAVNETEYSSRGTFTVYGTVEHTNIRAEAQIHVLNGYAASEKGPAQASLEMDLSENTVYRLSFTLQSSASLVSEAADIFIYDGNTLLGTVYKMQKADFLEYLGFFSDNDRVNIFFETPENGALSLRLPENSQYFTDVTLAEITAANADLVINYMYGEELLLSKTVNAPLDSVFTLSEDDFYPTDGYEVSSLGAPSAIHSLDASVTLDSTDMVITLNCRYTPSFNAEHSLTNTVDINGNRHVVAKATLFNGTDTAKTALLTVALFDKDGNLTQIQREDISLPAEQSTKESYTIDSTLQEDEFAYAFLWDSSQSLLPIAQKIDSRNPEGLSDAPDEGYVFIPATARYVEASTYQTGNGPANILTRDLDTRWSAYVEGDAPVYAIVDLRSLHALNTIGLGFYNGDLRRSIFEIEVSPDGDSWQTVVTKRKSSGQTAQIEYYTFNEIEARYVKLSGWGWESSVITSSGIETRSDRWFSVTAFEAYGTSLETPDVSVSPDEWASLSGRSLSTNESAANAYWGANALNEETFTDYTPSTGSKLYADFTDAPEIMKSDYSALHIYDEATRYDEGSDSAGAIGVFRKYSAPSSNYKIKFKWYVPTTVGEQFYSPDWAGITLSAGRPTGGADNTHPCAVQLRLAASGRSNLKVKTIRSTMFNDGSLSDCMGVSTPFTANTVWDVELLVREDAAVVEATINDGTITETALINFNNLDAERTKTETWTSNILNYITFSSGAGGISEIYVSDFTIEALPDVVEESGSSVTLLEDALYEFIDGDEISTDSSQSVFAAPINEGADMEYVPALGSQLYADIVNLPQAAGLGNRVKALHLFDNVGRETTVSRGSGGEFVYVDIPELSGTNVYEITFDMYAPTAGEYSGFSLGRGANSGGDDVSHPLALQMRFSPQSDGMQFNYYNSIQYNKGSQSAGVGTSSNRFKYNAIWNVKLSYNPILSQITVRISDGSVTQSKTLTLPTQGSDSTFTNDWTQNPINKLIFNTGVGTTSNIYVANIKVVDTGVEKISQRATGGPVRFEYSQSNGTFLVFSASEGSSPTFKSGTNPYYTRFIERRGLYDSDCVSLQPLNMPGYFLCVNSDWSVTIQKNDDSEAFRKAATFYKVHALGVSNSDAYSYKSFLQSSQGNDLYLYNNNSTLKVTNYSSSTFKACSFFIRDESVSYVSDSFRGTSISSQWYKGYPWYTNYHNHSGVANDSNIVVENGNVSLIATDQRGKWIKNSKGSTGYQDTINNVWRYYKAYVGVISINSKVYNRGSYLEGSFKQPNSPRGYWTAFWINGRDSWPPETDIFEFLSSKGGYTWYTATHGGTEGAGWEYTSNDLRTTWNTFTLDWGYDYMKMYINGSLYFTAPDTSYQKNMYLILNTGMGAWESEPDDTTVWNTGLQLQWFRSYQYY